ncbi:MAG: hypothetical protein VKK04_18295 [Synechococcales bacterium]|nr:hypothetical protein [Synechococcales bacterium]
MQRPLFLCALMASPVLAVAATWAIAPLSQAQTFPPCEPPANAEYLLMIPQPTEADQAELRQVLPNGTTTTVCDYLGDVVFRVGRFAREDNASAWAEYLVRTYGLQAAVIRPSTTAAQPQPAPPTRSPSRYNPELLGAGYAVLVDYFNQPELAAAVQQALQQSVGLVVYEQRPYLLATQTTDAAAAGRVLQTLSDRDLTAFMVDSRDVVLLTPQVAVVP